MVHERVSAVGRAFLEDVLRYLGFPLDEGGFRATEEIRIRFGFEEDDITEIDLSEFREWARTARHLWIDATTAYWSDEAVYELFDLAQCVDVESGSQGSGYYPQKPYQLPTIDTHHGDDFEKIIRRVRNLFQGIIDGAAEIDEEGYNRDDIEFENEAEESISSLLWAANLLHDLLPGWERIFSNHHEVSEEDRRQAVDFYRENIDPKLETGSDVVIRDQRTPLDILRLPFWKHRWHTYEIWVTVQTLKALDSCDPEVRVVDGRIPLDGQSTEIVAELDAIDDYDACVVTELETPVQMETRSAIRPDLSICRTQDLDAESRAVVIEYKQRAALSPSHVKERTQSYLSGSPKAVGLAMVNYDAVPDVELPEIAELLGNVHPGSRTVDEYRELVKELMNEAELLGTLEGTAVLLDVSGSMRNAYTDPEVQDALQTLLEWKEKGLDVYQFNTGLTTHPQITVSDVEAGLETGGGTDVKRAIRQMCQEFRDPSVLLVVTDGHDPLPESNPEVIDTVKECSPQELPSELDWLRGTD